MNMRKTLAVDFVGSTTSNPGMVSGMDIDHEGHGGWNSQC